MPADLKENFKKLKDLVSYCLQNFPECRENDKTLMLKVWSIQGFRMPHKLIPFFYKVASPESIRRVRQKINSEGLFLPDEEKVARRTLWGMRHRQMFRDLKKEKEA